MKKITTIVFILFVINSGSQTGPGKLDSPRVNEPIVVTKLKQDDDPETVAMAKKYDSALTVRDGKLNALIVKLRNETDRANKNAKKAQVNAKKAEETESKLKQLENENRILRKALLTKPDVVVIKTDTAEIIWDSLPMPVFNNYKHKKHKQ